MLLMFPINSRPIKFVIKLLPKILLSLNIARIDIRLKGLCDKVVYACLLTLQFVPNWLVMDHNNINLDDNDDDETMIVVKPVVWLMKKQLSKKLILVACYPTRF